MCEEWKTLKEWCDEKKGRSSFLVKNLKITWATLRDWKTGEKDIPAKRSVQIELLTNGEIPRQITRPDDWFEYWPELPDAKRMLNEKNPLMYGRRATDLVRA